MGPSKQSQSSNPIYADLQPYLTRSTHTSGQNTTLLLWSPSKLRLPRMPIEPISPISCFTAPRLDRLKRRKCGCMFHQAQKMRLHYTEEHL
ncbi:Uncharacterized protein HZ326_23785 [Fusarium oxysporum f. sp. albedinis]|nr:Uncharacterized protein HZ326_23785 [Fusarium oxysporum f. sp. albedinis]